MKNANATSLKSARQKDEKDSARGRGRYLRVEMKGSFGLSGECLAHGEGPEESDEMEVVRGAYFPISDGKKW